MLPNINTIFPTVRETRMFVKYDQSHIYRPQNNMLENPNIESQCKNSKPINFFGTTKFIKQELEDIINILDPNKQVFGSKKTIVYACSYCDKILANHYSLGGHMSKYHPEQSKRSKKVMEKRKIIKKVRSNEGDRWKKNQ